MWSLPSRSRAAALASVVAFLFVVQPSTLEPVKAQAPAVSPAIQPPAGANLLANSQFDNGMDSWLQYATPDPSYVYTQLTNGVLSFYRVPPPAGTPMNQAVVWQWTWLQLAAGSPLHASFDLGNSSDVRKRISVLIHEGDFTDLHVCTFWLAPHSPLQTYRMRTHNTKAWSNTSLSFYAATPGSFGGFYEVDNVSLTYEPSGHADRTLCDDPTAPVATNAPASATLLANGDFSTGLGPWAAFHGLQYQLSNGIFEFVWVPPSEARIAPVLPTFEPAPVVIQRTGVPLPAGEILTAQVDLGNSSPVRKRVSVLIHQWDFDDLAACTFWLEPNTPLQTYTMRMFTTEAWTDASLSVYAATRGPETWIQLDNAVLQRTPSAQIGGKECYEPGAFDANAAKPSVRSERSSPRRSGGFASWMGTARSRDAQTQPSAPGRWLPNGLASSTSLRYAVPPSADELAVEVSEDGENWHTVHTVSPSEDWRVLTLDLSELNGPVMFVRVRGT